jgi:hypothetical protein
MTDEPALASTNIRDISGLNWRLVSEFTHTDSLTWPWHFTNEPPLVTTHISGTVWTSRLADNTVGYIH